MAHRFRLPTGVVFCAVLALFAVSIGAGRRSTSATAQAPDTVAVRASDRAAGLRFSPAVAAADREWVLAAIAKARPEAQALIAEVDGLVEVRTHRGLPIGVTDGRKSAESASFTLSLDTFLLNGRRRIDRDVVVLHELGHVIDFALVSRELNEALEAGIPRTGVCVDDEQGLAGSCTEPQERFADTFAKWALRGGVSAVGAGYGVATPASLEDWGAPLTALAGELSR